MDSHQHLPNGPELPNCIPTPEPVLVQGEHTAGWYSGVTELVITDLQ